MAEIDNLRNLRSKLISNFERNDLDQFSSTLEEVKLFLLRNNLFEPNIEQDADIMILARDCLEAGALGKIRSNDIQAFSRYALQLKPFYSASFLPESENKYKIIGLQMLLLLAENRLADFHAFIERLLEKSNMENTYINWTISLESAIMEGSFDRVRNILKQPPCEEYAAFIPIVFTMVREEIADCIECAYKNLPIESCAALLFLDDPSELQSAIASRDWKVREEIIYFDVQNNYENSLKFTAQDKLYELDSENDSRISGSSLIIKNILRYAQEMEQIV